jgi:hypothetical protein
MKNEMSAGRLVLLRRSLDDLPPTDIVLLGTEIKSQRRSAVKAAKEVVLS